MVRNTCPVCGAVTDDLTQKFCTRCGAQLPEIHGMPGPKGVPRWVYAAAGLILILIFAAALWQPLAHGIAGNAAGGSATAGAAESVTGPADITALPSAPVSGTADIPGSATIPETAQETPPLTTETTVAMTTTPVPKNATTATTLPTPPPTKEIVTQITLAETWIPTQPPSDSYTSKTPGAPYIDPSALETRIHELINDQRQQNGLSSLSYDSFLADIARGHSYDMALHNYFEHTDPAGMDARARGEWAGYPCVRDFRTYYTSGISENLYQGYRYQTYLTAPNGTIMAYNWSTVEFIANQAVNGWMNSEGHRNNILDYHFQQEGIGVSFSSDDKIYVTENFC